MAEARVSKAHSLGAAVARERAQAAVNDLAAKYGARVEWRGDQIHFWRGPIRGHVTVGEASVEFYANLGLLGALLKGKVESRAREVLDRYFS
jgi:putative polyhydroxyalkanoate system protein